MLRHLTGGVVNLVAVAETNKREGRKRRVSTEGLETTWGALNREFSGQHQLIDCCIRDIFFLEAWKEILPLTHSPFFKSNK